MSSKRQRSRRSEPELETDDRVDEGAAAESSPEHGGEMKGRSASGEGQPGGAGEGGATAEDRVAELEEIGRLKDEIESLTAELEELRDQHLRLAAEFDNFRKRTGRERAQEAQRAQGALVRELLESLDDLTRVSQEGAAGEGAALLEGVQLVERKLRRALERSGLTPVEAVGKPFDPELHEALTTVPTEDVNQDGVVAQELAIGYLFNDMLLRPALVQVKKHEPRGANESERERADEADDES